MGREEKKMELLFLGTGAADWPLTRKTEMKEFRRRSSMLIDRCLLIDPGPQVLEALEEYGIEVGEIKYIIYTHKHEDHFSEKTLEILTNAGAKMIEISAGKECQIGIYHILAYQGNHATCENTVHFIIKDEEHTIFYGLDGAWLMYEEVQGIKKYRPDLAVLDATIGDIEGDYRIFEHNNLNMVLEMKKTLTPYTKQFCISHMARTLHTEHQVLSEKMEKHQVWTAYDGMKLQL